MTSPVYKVNPATNEVIKDDGTGWKPVASVRNKTTGEFLIDEGNGWQPIPGRSPGAKTVPGNTEEMFRHAPDQPADPNFDPGNAEAWLSAMQAGGAEKRRYDAGVRIEEAAGKDDDAKERFFSLANGRTLGAAPYVQGAVNATLGAVAYPFLPSDTKDVISFPEFVGETFQTGADAVRGQIARGREERPLESVGLELTGGLAAGKTMFDDLAGFLRNRYARATVAGGTSGAAYGLLDGTEEGSDRAGKVATSAAAGAALGPVIVGAGDKIVTPAYRKGKEVTASIYDALNSLIGKQTNARDTVAQEVAVAAVRRSMERSGLTFGQIMDLVKKYEGKPAVLAEVLGQDAINSLTALTRRPGSTPQKAQDIIEERFYGRADRMKGDVEDAAGIPVGQLDNTLEAQLAERRSVAAPLYDALFKQFKDVKSFGESLKRVNRLARAPQMQRHLDLADKALRTQAAVRGVPLSKMSVMERWDLVKRSLDDAIASAVSKGEARTRVGESVEELTALKNELVKELDRLTGGAYAAARDAGGEAPRLTEAASAGQKALRARSPRDVEKTVSETNPQDLPAFRAGIVEDLGVRIDKGMKPHVVRVQDVAGKLRAGLGDDAANKLIARLDAEATLSDTGARWAPRMNSVTGTVMESGATQMGDDLVNAGINLTTGNKLGLMRQAINWMRQRGFSQRQIDAIGDLLLSAPEEGLKRLKLMSPDGAPTAPVNGLNAALGGDKPPPSGGGAPAKSANGFNEIMSRGEVVDESGPIRASGFAGFPTGRLNKRPRSTPESMADHDEKLTNLFGGNPPPPRTPRDVEIERLGQVERDALAELDDLDNRVVEMGVDPAILGDRRILPTDVSPNAWPQVQDIMAQMDDAATRLMRARDGMASLRNAPEGDAFGAPTAAKPTRGNGFTAAIRGDMGAALSGVFGGGVMPIPIEEDDTLTDILAKRGTAMAAGAVAGVAARRGMGGRAAAAADDAASAGLRLPDNGYDALRIGKASVEVTRVDDGMTINRINVPENMRGQGEASRALKEVLRQADDEGVTVFLTADPVGPKGLTKSQLEEFYRRHGFEKDGNGSMVRPPASPAASAGFGPKDLGRAAKAVGGVMARPAKDLASIGKSTLTAATKATGEDAAGPRMGRAPGDPSQVELPATPAAFERTRAEPVPDFRPNQPAPRNIDDAITQTTSRLIARLRSRFAPLDDPRQYGPRLAQYDVPDTLDPERALFDQVNNPRLAAQDVAEGSDDAARRGLDYVNAQRMARMEGNETNAARAGGISEKQAATRELKAARAEIDAFYGTQAEHRGFKGKAKKTEEARRLKRFRDAVEAWNQTRAIPVPGKAELPSDRDQILYQEIARRSPEGKLSPRARELERRALDMLLDPEMSTAGAYAAKAAPDGFKPSDDVARATGYGALTTGVVAAGGGTIALVNAMAETDRKAEEAAKTHMDRKAAWPADRPKPKNEWGGLPFESRTTLQATLNFVNGKGGQIPVDGGWGEKTAKAVERAQEKLGLPVTGVVDDETLAALNEQTELRMYRYRQQLQDAAPREPSSTRP